MPRSLRNYPQNFLFFMFVDALKSTFVSKSDWTAKQNKITGSYEQYRQTAYHLRRKGYVKITTNPSGQRFLQLTKKGELELLMAKTKFKRPEEWDGKWRLILFDIPEDAKNKRDRLRRLLKANDFIKLQESVYISPYPLNRKAIEHLKTSGLISFIRIGRLEELDDDRDLKKRFNLTSRRKKIA